MHDSIDEKSKQFLNNLVSSKHHALLEMLTEDAVMEFPYHLPTTPPQLVGKKDIVQFFAGFGDVLILNEIHPVVIHRTTNSDVVILEYEGKGKATQTGRSYFQKYFTVLTFRDGLICHWKDYWNPVNFLTATSESGSVQL